MLIAIGLAIILVVTAATGFFVALEFAYTAVDRSRLEDLANDGDARRAARARRALKICSSLSFALSGAQLGITVTALFVGFFAEPYLGRGLADLLGVAGVPAAVSVTVGVAFAFLFANVVQMILGELGPKNLAIARTEALALVLAAPTQAYLTICGPIIRFFDAASTKLLKRLGIQPVEELEHNATPEDLHRIIDVSRDEGALDRALSDLLDRGLDFSETVADQAMTPRVNVQTLSADATVADAVAALAGGHSRFPVVGDDVDDLRGVVGIGQIIGVPREERARVRVGEVADTALLVPASLPLPTLLERMRSQHRQLACVVDEFGGFAGIVTLEDLAEELVGEIRDEQDRFEAVPVSLAGGAWLIPGRWRIDEVADATGIELPEGEHYETIAGLVMAELGRIAHPGDTVDVDTVPRIGDSDDDDRDRVTRVRMVVVSCSRHVPQAVELRPQSLEVAS
ncbi:hemolysin family protein [Glycomyces sp. TRM65418]|uniref:hemolysin family protein n=1 Tax=Glycomyces sp. TRM65418 TaxID=2867006 RepID=UPI001CE64350|nr:hemolysin family protein [Glycomyces sp. TRM65418]MCC3764619.1 hemolysin family protein [Glycomyces sp. TRM65418]QZD54283.1 hemolysin family protein [Glycomyces sp. TRM65418]